MAWACSGKTNVELITNMLNAGLFKSERVGEASSGIRLTVCDRALNTMRLYV